MFNDDIFCVMNEMRGGGGEYDCDNDEAQLEAVLDLSQMSIIPTAVQAFMFILSLVFVSYLNIYLYLYSISISHIA